MAAVHIRDVPESTLAALRERARRSGVSMQVELRRILDEAAATPLGGPPDPPVSLVRVSTTGTGSWSRTDIYGSAGR